MKTAPFTPERYEHKNVTTLDEILDKKYGRSGTPKREEWEEAFNTFQINAVYRKGHRKLNIINRLH